MLIKTDPVYPEIVGEDFKADWRQMTEEEYHADKTAVSSTSVRWAKERPRLFYRNFCLGMAKPATKAMNFGKAAHMAILEPERFKALHVVQPDFGDMRTSANRQRRDGWLMEQAAGAVILSQDDRDRLLWMIDSLMNHTVAYNLIKGASFEQSGYFRDLQTGIKCRFRPDIIRPDLSAMPDLKTTRKIKRRRFESEVYEKGYHIQLAFYYAGINAIYGRPPELPCIIAIENEEPYDTCVYYAPDGMISRGEQDYMLGLGRIKQCMDLGQWPGYQAGNAEQMNLPAWTDGVED